MLVVAYQPAVQYQRALRLFNHPALGQRTEPAFTDEPGDDLHVDAEGRAVDGDLVLELRVDERLAHTRVLGAVFESGAVPTT